MRRSLINDMVRLPERQVLPRAVDHALDLSRCAHARRAGQHIQMTTLDFKDAGMFIPLDHEERPFNCTAGRRQDSPEPTSASHRRARNGNSGGVASARV